MGGSEDTLCGDFTLPRDISYTIYKAVIGVGVSKGTCVGFGVSISVGASVGICVGYGVGAGPGVDCGWT